MKKLIRITALVLMLSMLSVCVAAIAYADENNIIQLNKEEVFLKIGESTELYVSDSSWIYIRLGGTRRYIPFYQMEMWRTEDAAVADFTDDFYDRYPSAYDEPLPLPEYENSLPFPTIAYRDYPFTDSDGSIGKTATVIGKKVGTVNITAVSYREGSPNAPRDTCSVTVYRPGDLDLNDSITMTDALAALRVAAGITPCSGLAKAAGCVSGSETVTVTDALAILRIAAGLSGPQE